MYYKLKFATLILMFTFAFANTSLAEIYFNQHAENNTAGELIPHTIFHPDFPTTKGLRYRPKAEIDADAPEGSQVIFWDDLIKRNDTYYDTVPPATEGKVYYLATYFRTDRIDGNNVWHDSPPTVESFDKWWEIRGSDLRWILGMGNRNSSPDANKYTMFILHGGLNQNVGVYGDTLFQNGDYAKPNHFQLEYEKWYSVVWKFTVARTPVGGHVLWINGNKVLEYNDMKTIGDSGTFARNMYLHGTVAQPAYDAPPHHRKLDAMIVTDNWQDIIDGGYLDFENVYLDEEAPLPPQGLKTSK